MPPSSQALPMNGDPATVWLYGFIMSAWALLTAWPGEQSLPHTALSAGQLCAAFGMWLCADSSTCRRGA